MRDRFFKTVETLTKKLLGDAGEEEEWSDRPDEERMRQILEQCRNHDFLRNKWEEYKNYSSREAYLKFAGQVRPRRSGRLWWIGGIAAAMAVVGIGIGKWFLKEPQIPVIPVVENVLIEPGMKKAQLKLADGTVVNVVGDSMQIHEAKGAKITYAEGAIAYKTEQEITELVYNELIVPIAGECYITLDDGTRVWVNSDSKLKYPMKFVGKERNVFLEGEAYFEVAKDAKPFVVHTALGNVDVLGTVFDVKAYRTEKVVYTTLVSGKVSFKGHETLIIGPGEQVVAFADGKIEKREVDIAEFVGWRNGLYVFRKQKLETIMNDLARWYNVSVFYRSPDLKEIAFTGNLKRYDHINTFMEILQRTGDVKYSIKDNTIMLYK